LKLVRILVLLICLASLLSFTLPVAFADRGGIPIGRLDALIFESGQKAIIGWNGTEEILILSTDLHASETTMVLEILPLPSNPKTIMKADSKSFTMAHNIVKSHAPRVPLYGLDLHQGGPIEMSIPSSVEITFHEKIGTHDIAVVKPRNVAEFASWIGNFLKNNNITQEASLQKFETIIRNYIFNGFNYFVLDIIELSTKQQSVEPIYYQFETSSLFYPLKISSLASGETKITLFLLTREAIDELLCFPFKYAYYGSSSSIVNPTPVMFKIQKGEIRSIDESLSNLFGSNAYFTVLQYSGSNTALIRDLRLPVWTFRLSYVTLAFREILRHLIALLPIEIMVGFILLAAIVDHISGVKRKDIDIY